MHPLWQVSKSLDEDLFKITLVFNAEIYRRDTMQKQCAEDTHSGYIVSMGGVTTFNEVFLFCNNKEEILAPPASSTVWFHRPQTLLKKPVNGLIVFQEHSYLLWVCALEPTCNIPVVCMLGFLFVLFLFYSISCFISSHLMGIKWIILLVCHLAFVSRKLKGAEMIRLYFVLFYVFFPFFF